MGFEFVYAYLENISWFFWLGLIAASAAIIALAVMRANNDIDIDDWKPMMIGGIVVWFMFLFVCLSPGMDHIQRVRSQVIKPYITPTVVEEKTHETIYCPSNQSTNNILCIPSSVTN